MNGESAGSTDRRFRRLEGRTRRRHGHWCRLRPPDLDESRVGWRRACRVQGRVDCNDMTPSERPSSSSVDAAQTTAEEVRPGCTRARSELHAPEASLSSTAELRSRTEPRLASRASCSCAFRPLLADLCSTEVSHTSPLSSVQLARSARVAATPRINRSGFVRPSAPRSALSELTDTADGRTRSFSRSSFLSRTRGPSSQHPAAGALEASIIEVAFDRPH